MKTIEEILRKALTETNADDREVLLIEAAEMVIKPQADNLVDTHQTNCKWDDQLIIVQYMITGAMIDFAKLYSNQQIELAVDKTLEIVSGDVDGKFCYDGGSMCLLDARSESILSLRTQILNQIKDR